MTETGASERVRLTGFLRCTTPEDVRIIERELPAHVALTRSEQGCIFFEVSQTDDPLVWRVEEQFQDRRAFERHQQRTRASDWFAKTAHIPRDYKIEGGQSQT